MLLQVDNIEKSFGSRKVLNGVSFSADGGECVAILGANGAGKTTLLRIINRIIEPDAGQVLLSGHPLTHLDLSAIGYLPEERGLYRHMGAGEQVCYLARLKGLSLKEADAKARQWFDRLGIADCWKRPVGRLSKGMQQRVQFIAAVVHSPSLLVLDEPFSGFDREGAAMLRSEIANLRNHGTTVLLSTHNLQAAADLCNKTIQL